MTLRKILFVDRDGTLIQEPADGQIDALDKLRLVPHVIPSLLELGRAGFRLVMVTNQDGLGSESFPHPAFAAPHQAMMEIFSSQGVVFDDVLICPHVADAGCLCRKPHLGLVRPYLSAGDLDLTFSCVVGDRDSDMLLAKNMGLRGLRLGAGSPASERVFASWPEIVDALLATSRCAEVTRTTRETAIRVKVDLDPPAGSRGTSACVRDRIATGIGFLDHMLEQLAQHGGFALAVAAQGDLHVDSHHTVEDTALALGQAVRQALGDKIGIGRYGFVLPMDEARAQACLDLSGRATFVWRGDLGRDTVGGLPTELVSHFFRSFADSLGASVHIEVDGQDTHHMVEATFKALGRCLRQAVRRSAAGELPSTKGTL